MFDGTFHEFEVDNHENKSLEHLQLLKRSLDQIEWRLQQKLSLLNREYRGSVGLIGVHLRIFDLGID